MFKEFYPDYTNILSAAQNKAANRIPLYEHCVDDISFERILGREFSRLQEGSLSEKEEYIAATCEAFLKCGYDTVTFERWLSVAFPGSGALGGHKPPVITNREDFEKYPWDEVEDNFFRLYGPLYDALRRKMPLGMKAIGGVGCGVFECVEDLVGYMELCLMSYDDPELYADLFKKVGDVSYAVWERFMREYGDIYCVMRFGDDLGYKSNTLLPSDDVKKHIIPQYKRIIDLVHSCGKPFLLHSCGNIFGVMDELIEVAGIDAKHSNEDQIAPFGEWVDRYGSRIGNFGGVDVDVLCNSSQSEIKEYVTDILCSVKGKGGIAIGSGNSIAGYVPTENYLCMINTVREFRGDK